MRSFHERVIVLDTETTGLSKENDRIVEIGGVELIGNLTTGRTFHRYINPYPIKVSDEAYAVHGLSSETLMQYPKFRSVIDEFNEFIGDSPLVIHNAPFDMGFINAEMERNRASAIKNPVKDTLVTARLKYPGQRVTLDALCQRFGVDSSERKLHGALLDSQLLAEVYISLMGYDTLDLGDPAKSDTETSSASVDTNSSGRKTTSHIAKWPSRPLISPTNKEIEAHSSFHKDSLKDSIWMANMKNLLTDTSSRRH